MTMSMNLGYYFETDPDFQCKCGRTIKQVHCPSCGSFGVYALASRCETFKMSNGQTIQVPFYRCRKCSLVFNYLEHRELCEAPKLENKSMRERREKEAARISLAGLPQAERMKIINQMLAKSGALGVTERRKAMEASSELVRDSGSVKVGGRLLEKRDDETVKPTGPSVFDLGPGEDK